LLLHREKYRGALLDAFLEASRFQRTPTCVLTCRAVGAQMHQQRVTDVPMNFVQQLLGLFMRVRAQQSRGMATQMGVVERGEAIAHQQDLARMHAEFAQAQHQQQRGEVHVAGDFAAQAHRLSSRGGRR
jgi:hypothetical protein